MAERGPPSSESTVLASSRKGIPDLRLLHYNDVYHIEPGSAEPAGGVARFKSVVNHYQTDRQYDGQPSLVTFFSGDAFNPSLESSVTKGKHMVPFLNAIGTDVACVGNHDLDFGIQQFRHLRSQCTFPWLLANVLDPALGDDVALANCHKSTILTSSTGIKIGVIGLAEREWLDTVNSLPPDLIYKSASATAKEIVPLLRKQGCELIVAVTHMREPNDLKLAEKSPPGSIDLILGGHDHFYSCSKVNSTYVLRSGTDFKQLSYIEAWKTDSQGWEFSITRRDMVRSIPEDPTMIQLADKLTANLKVRLGKAVGYTAVPLDGRFTTVRTRESNLGNFVCDLMRFYYRTDCALMAGGTIRGDQIYPPGPLRLKDVMNCFPFEDPVVVLMISGERLREALENSVSLVPALEGRYPQVANIVFEYDPKLSPSSRVIWVKVNGEDLQADKMYTLATRGYMARGKDGFGSLLVQSEGGEAKEIVSEENGVLISTILRQYFLSLKIVGRWRRWGPSLKRHWGTVQRDLREAGTIKEPKTPQTYKRHSPENSKNEEPTSPSSSFRRNNDDGIPSPRIRHQKPLDCRPKEDRTSSSISQSNSGIDIHKGSSFPNNLRTTSLESQVTDDDNSSDTANSDSDTSDADQIPPPTPLSAHPLYSPRAAQPVSTITATTTVTTTATTTGPTATLPTTTLDPDLNLTNPDLGDHLFHLARSYAKRWMAIAGVKREGVAMVDEETEDSLPAWTRGIAPKLEGRIRIVGVDGSGVKG